MRRKEWQRCFHAPQRKEIRQPPNTPVCGPCRVLWCRDPTYGRIDLQGQIHGSIQCALSKAAGGVYVGAAMGALHISCQSWPSEWQGARWFTLKEQEMLLWPLCFLGLEAEVARCPREVVLAGQVDLTRQNSCSEDRDKSRICQSHSPKCPSRHLSTSLSPHDPILLMSGSAAPWKD